ncbi:MAG: glycosyltransferase family 4 protein [Deltaproteobacteria bacterium]|nr:glycosyltransferase family 4 protein [Deltaproteobacteria bacterium]
MKVEGGKYNILFLVNGAKSPRGGEFQFLSLITHLRRDIFHPITAYACDGPVVREIKKADIMAIHVPMGDRMTKVHPRKISLLSPFFFFPFAWEFLSGGAVWKIRKLLKAHKIRLIYCADNLSKLIGGLAGKMSGIRTIAHCHDDFKEDILGKVMRFFYFLLLDRICTVSEKVRRFFTRRGKIPSKVETVYNGVDTDLFDPERVADARKELKLSSDTVVVGSIGALETDKGQRYLLKALSLLNAEGVNNMTCLICGTGPDDADLRKLAHSKKLEVRFLGHRSDIPSLLKTTDILVLTPQTRESFSMAAIEAMSMRVPVVATRVGGIPEVVSDGETGILVPPGDVVSLAGAIRTLYDSPELRKTMGNNGRDRVIKKFSLQISVMNMERLFLGLIEETA